MPTRPDYSRAAYLSKVNDIVRAIDNRRDDTQAKREMADRVRSLLRAFVEAVRTGYGGWEHLPENVLVEIFLHLDQLLGQVPRAHIQYWLHWPGTFPTNFHPHDTMPAVDASDFELAHSHHMHRQQRTLRALGHRQQRIYGMRYAQGGRF
ncbi:hypothetical protein JCM10207_005831 [Rhodosporidiobolus poonsookiae]